jgi:hypothetical protein
MCARLSTSFSRWFRCGRGSSRSLRGTSLAILLLVAVLVDRAAMRAEGNDPRDPETPPASTVSCRDGLVTLTASKTTGYELLSDVAQACGARLRGGKELVQGVGPFDLKAVSIAEVLRGSAGVKSFALRYRGDDVAEIEILQEADPRESASLPSGASPGAGAPAEDVAAVEPRFQSESRILESGDGVIALDRKLGLALGRSEIVPRDLAMVAATHEKRSVRRAAIRKLMAAIEGDPTLLTELFGDFGQMDISSIAAAIADVDPKIEQTVWTAGRALKDPKMKADARAVARELRAARSATGGATDPRRAR